MEEFRKRASQDEREALEVGQLLRSRFEGTQEGRETRQYRLNGGLFRVLTCDGERGLATMLSLGGDPMQQERSTGDRLVMLVGIGESHKEIPPVGDKRHHASHVAAAFEVVGREATPTPLVLQFIEIVLAVRPVAGELGCREDLGVGGGDQDRILVGGGSGFTFDEDLLEEQRRERLRAAA